MTDDNREDGLPKMIIWEENKEVVGGTAPEVDDDDDDEDDGLFPGGEDSSDEFSHHANDESLSEEIPSAPARYIDHPSDLDVICDKQHHQHPGNVEFRKLVRKYYKSYQKEKARPNKGSTTREIMRIVHAAGGHFVKRVKNSEKWLVLDGKAVHEKVSSALRSTKDPKRGARKTRNEGGVMDAPQVDRQVNRIYQMQMRNLMNLVHQTSK